MFRFFPLFPFPLIAEEILFPLKVYTRGDTIVFRKFSVAGMSPGAAAFLRPACWPRIGRQALLNMHVMRQPADSWIMEHMERYEQTEESDQGEFSGSHPCEFLGSHPFLFQDFFLFFSPLFFWSLLNVGSCPGLRQPEWEGGASVDHPAPLP